MLKQFNFGNSVQSEAVEKVGNKKLNVLIHFESLPQILSLQGLK